MSATVAAPARPPAAPVLHWLWQRRHAVLAFLIVFLCWEGLVRWFAVPSYLLPPPSDVWAEFARRWPRVQDHMWITTAAIVSGYLTAIVVSVPLALLIAHSETAERGVYPVIVFLQIMPKIAVAPLFVIWFGVGFTPKVLLVFLLCFFPIVIAAIAGFRSVRPEVMELARSTGASAWRMFRLISLPSALPQIFTGLKVAAALAATAAVVAEFVASDRGLGYLLLEFNGQTNTEMVFGLIVLLSVIGLGLYFLVELIERLAIPWHVSMRGKPSGAIGA
jgi:NitT/TauT family transport system permease protein